MRKQVKIVGLFVLALALIGLVFQIRLDEAEKRCKAKCQSEGKAYRYKGPIMGWKDSRVSRPDRCTCY